MHKHLHIAIVGYGTAGQACALALARDGHRVEVFERVVEPGPVGAGFLLQPSGLQALWSLGLLDGVLAHGARVHRLHGETPTGRAVMDMRYRQLDAHLFGIGMQRGTLFTLLARAWEGFDGIHRGHAIDQVDARQGRVCDQHGRWHGPYDLVVVADGAASKLRDQFGTHRIDRPYPWGALWCLLRADAWPWPDELRQRYVGARRMIGMLPVGTAPDDPTPKLSFFWSLRADAFARWQDDGAAAWLDEIAAIWPQARACMGDGFEVGRLARASYRDAVPRRWWQERMVLVGDAAHAMSPQLGQGVNMALLDALALRDGLRSERGLDTALAGYEHTRRAHVGIYHLWSRWLTPLFQSDRDSIAAMRDLAFLPLGRLPGGRGHMLRVLSGTQRGLFGKLGLAPEFVAALAKE